MLLVCPAALSGQGAAAWAPHPAAVSYRIESAALGEARDLAVVMPRGDSASPRNVLVVLDGDGLLPIAAGVAGFEQLSRGATPWLIVAVRSMTPTDRMRLFTPDADSATRARYPQAGGAPAFARFLTDELKPFIAARHRTTARWALVGHSLAGLFVVHQVRAPGSAFTDLVAISPTLAWQGEAVPREVLARPAGPVRLFLSTADEGERYPVEPSRRLHAALSGRASGHVVLRHFAGEDHVSTVPPAMIEALRWLARVVASP
jgi:predicted alpha/beta superfamily hydrolase